MVATSYRFDSGRRQYPFWIAFSNYVCVAQLDRALGYGPRCRGFESSHARFAEKGVKYLRLFYLPKQHEKRFKKS